MGYLGDYAIDDALTFYVNSHDPSDGAAIVADSLPTYRIYEDETTTPIATGTMAYLDSGNTTGFYSERITALSAASGYEVGKSYCIRMSVVVSSVTAAAVDTFQIS